MRPRVLVLPIAAVVIAGLCLYKVMQPVPAPVTAGTTAARGRAPGIELGDHHRPQRLVKLGGYLGRHAVLVVFFDGEAGADRDESLMRLVRERDRVEALDVKVLGVTGAVPQFNRAAVGRLVEAGVLADAEAFPFPLLSDVGGRDPALFLAAHRRWGRYDEPSGRTRSGVFFIDRAGTVELDPATGEPRPLEDPAAFLDELLGGE